jgi:hypothetical protein
MPSARRGPFFPWIHKTDFCGYQRPLFRRAVSMVTQTSTGTPSGMEFLTAVTRAREIISSWDPGISLSGRRPRCYQSYVTRTNRIISISQPRMQTSVASNPYGGYTSGSSIILIDGWPASVLGETRSSHSTTDLPTDQAIPYWNVLMPSPAGVVLSPGDIITDDLGRTAMIVGSELTDLGWRISAKMATT